MRISNVVRNGGNALEALSRVGASARATGAADGGRMDAAHI